MLNGKCPLLLIELNSIPIPIYIDENVFKISADSEDKAVTLNTSKTGSLTSQIIAQNTLQLSFTVSRESQYGVIIVSLLDKLYTMIGTIHDKYITSSNSEDTSGSLWNFSSILSGIGSQLSNINYKVSYFSETDTISDAVISSYTKISEKGTSEIKVTLTLEKKAPETGKLDFTESSNKIGIITLNRGA